MDDSLIPEARYYTYKGKAYHTWGYSPEDIERVKNPTTDEWFDAVRYRPVLLLTDAEGKEYYSHTYDEAYLREVNDFKEKFSVLDISGKKEI